MRGKNQPMKLACKAATDGAHENHPTNPASGQSTGRVTVAYELLEASREKVRELEARIADLKVKPSRRNNVIETFGTPEWILAQRDEFPSDVKRTLLKLMIERIVIIDWPKDLQKTGSVRSGETIKQSR